MANRHLEPDSPELRARWGSFAWSADNAAQAKVIVARYPAGRQRSPSTEPFEVMSIYSLAGDKCSRVEFVR